MLHCSTSAQMCSSDFRVFPTARQRRDAKIFRLTTLSLRCSTSAQRKINRTRELSASALEQYSPSALSTGFSTNSRLAVVESLSRTGQ